MNINPIPFKPNHNWTLFLDRDGVINERIIDGYVLDYKDFILTSDFIPAMKILRNIFGRIVVVTNQQCVGKGFCTHETIENIHDCFIKMMKDNGVEIDAVFFCPHLATAQCECRKPKIGLALQAKERFPEINFSQSIMVGDQLSDIQFGNNCKMFSVYIGDQKSAQREEIFQKSDLICDNMLDFANKLQ